MRSQCQSAPTQPGQSTDRRIIVHKNTTNLSVLLIIDNNNDALDTVSHPDPDERTRSQCQSAPPSLDNQPLEGYSSIETLLMNIQGLLKVAAENARHQERKTGMEKGIK